MSNLKNEYEKMYASDELRKRIGKTFMKKKGGLPAKRVLGIAACFVAVCLLSVNIFPGIAEAASNVPVLRDVIRIVTFGRYEKNDGYYQANIETPKIEGLLDKELEARLNEEFRGNADELIRRFEADVSEFKRENGDAEIHWGVDSGYEILTDNDEYFVLDVFVTTTAASSTTEHTFYNIDRADGKLLTFSMLFDGDADYVTPVSEYIYNEMKRRNAEDGEMYWLEDEHNGFDKIDAEQKFYINKEGNIVIVFDEYTVAPGAAGAPRFEIPAEVVADIRK